MEGLARFVRADIWLARRETERGLEEGDRALALARAVRDPQAMFPSLSSRARQLVEAGRVGQGETLLDELLDRADGQELLPNE